MNAPPVSFNELYRRAQQVVNPRRLSINADAGSVGAALLSTSNTVYVGVCIDTICSMGFCAEHAAAAAMITAGEHRVLRMIAVGQQGRIMSPCGRCREFISQLHKENSNAEVMTQDRSVITLEALLPYS